MQCMTNAIPAGGGGSWTPDPVLENNSWDDIKRASDDGIASSVFSVGDTKGVPLNGTVGILALNMTLHVFILGFDHNAELEGPGITFGGFKTADGKDVALVDNAYNSSGSTPAFRMNLSTTSSGGWKDSYMRNNICGVNKSNVSGTVMVVIPSELLNVVKSIKKYTNNSGSSTASTAITETEDYFFIPSEFEVFGSTTYSNPYEKNYQKQYTYYASGNSKIKYNHKSTGNKVYWFTRSPASYSGYFVMVTDAGGISGQYADQALAFVLCFVV